MAYSWAKLGIQLDDLIWSNTPYDKKLAFAQSKLANILFTRELAARTVGTSVRTYCLHPGTVASAQWLMYIEQNMTWVANFVKPLFRKTLAQTTLFCCVDESIKEQSGL